MAVNATLLTSSIRAEKPRLLGKVCFRFIKVLKTFSVFYVLVYKNDRTQNYDPGTTPYTDAAAYAPGKRFVCTHQVATLFCVK